MANYFKLLWLVLLGCVLCSPAQAARVKKGNIGEFRLLAEGGKFICRERAGFPPQLGQLKKKKLRVGARWQPIFTDRVAAKITRLASKIDKLRDRGGKQKKIAKFERKLGKLQQSLAEFQTFEGLCGSGSGVNQFAGSATSLLPYRDNLTEAEINHLLDKVAFGGSDELRQIGRQQGLTALVNALVDGLMTDSERAALEQESLYWAAMAFYYPEDRPEVGRIWSTPAVQLGQGYRFIYSRDPFHEWMLFVMSSHFATNLDQLDFSFSEYGHYGLPLHWNLLREHSAGNFQSLVNDLFLDPAMNVWLDNKDNRADAPNQNYARELLELFTLGAIDPVTGAANYDEESIVSTTAYVSGYFETNQSDPETGREVIDMSYNDGLHDTRDFTIFRGIPGAELSGALSPQALVQHVLYNHPGSSRYIAERFAGQMLYPGLGEEMVAALAASLRDNNYDLRPFFRTVLQSSAMFSEQSRGSCVASPVEQTMRLARRLLKQPLPTEGEMQERSLYLLGKLLQDAGSAGQRLFEPPSVFGWKGACNINRSGSVARGEGWITAQRLLNRSRGCTEFMNHLNWIDYDFVNSLGLVNGMSAANIVRQAATEVFGIVPTEAEEGLLVRFLTTEQSENGESQTLAVDLSEDWYVRRKIPRLICLLSDAADLNMR